MKLYTKARKVFEKLLYRAFYCSALAPHRPGCLCERCGPGAIVRHLSEKDREGLKELTADDVNDHQK